MKLILLLISALSMQALELTGMSSEFSCGNSKPNVAPSNKLLTKEEIKKCLAKNKFFIPSSQEKIIGRSYMVGIPDYGADFVWGSQKRPHMLTYTNASTGIYSREVIVGDIVKNINASPLADLPCLSTNNDEHDNELIASKGEQQFFSIFSGKILLYNIATDVHKTLALKNFIVQLWLHPTKNLLLYKYLGHEIFESEIAVIDPLTLEPKTKIAVPYPLNPTNAWWTNHFHPREAIVGKCPKDGQIELQTVEGKQIITWEEKDNRFQEIEWAPSGDFIAATKFGNDKISFYCPEQKTRAFEILCNTKTPEKGLKMGNYQGKFIIVYQQNEAKIINVSDKRIMKTITCDQEILQAKMNPEGNLIALATKENIIITDQNTHINTIKCPGEKLKLKWSPQSTLGVIAVDRTHRLYFYTKEELTKSNQEKK